MNATPTETILLSINETNELFESRPQPGRIAAGEARTWDDIGAALGEAGAARLLRLALHQPDARRLVVRVGGRHPSTPESRNSQTLALLRDWLDCKLAANTDDIRTTLRFGMRALAVALVALALALGTSVVLQSETLLGPTGPFRSLIAEALVIAGWVVMWRPVEMLLFDSWRPRLENRLIRRINAMPWSLEEAPRIVVDRSQTGS